MTNTEFVSFVGGGNRGGGGGVDGLNGGLDDDDLSFTGSTSRFVEEEATASLISGETKEYMLLVSSLLAVDQLPSTGIYLVRTTDNTTTISKKIIVR